MVSYLGCGWLKARGYAWLKARGDPSPQWLKARGDPWLKAAGDLASYPAQSSWSITLSAPDDRFVV